MRTLWNYRRTVWKYQLDLIDEPQLRPMPRDATVVHVATQEAVSVCLWAEVDPNRNMVDRWFTVVGTGHRVPDDGAYIGTAHTHGGALVWHIYEEVH